MNPFENVFLFFIHEDEAEETHKNVKLQNSYFLFSRERCLLGSIAEMCSADDEHV